MTDKKDQIDMSKVYIQTRQKRQVEHHGKYGDTFAQAFQRVLDKLSKTNK